MTWSGGARIALRALAFVLVNAVGSFAQPLLTAAVCAPPSGLIFVGDDSAAPTEFLDDKGNPAGIHVDLVRGIEKAIGIPITIRLMSRVDASAALQRGEAHLTTLARTELRDTQFDYLAPTVRSRVSVLLHSNVRPVADQNDLRGLRISTTPGSYTYELFSRMPPGQRPDLVVVQDKDEAVALWREHQVDGMAGSGAALVWMARGLGLRDFVELSFESVVMEFATRQGCGPALQAVSTAMQTMRAQGTVDIVRDQWLTAPESNVWRYVRIGALVFLVALGSVLAWIWTLRRQVRERTSALEASKTAAEAATKAKSEFLATMSHEIRTPLNAVIATASVLDTTSLDRDQRELVEVIRQGGNSLLSVVSDVLDFSKVEAGRLELHPQPFDTHALLRDTAALVERTASDKGLGVRTDIAPGLSPWLFGDAPRLRQILLNLLSNAVKFTDAGSVELSASSRPDADGRVELRVSVRDTGVGIPPERLHRVFQPFTQADSSTTRRFGGTGLGLTISRSLMELMGGRIHVESEVGRGSTFWFEVTLPLAEAPAFAVAPVASRPAEALKVLMAEDNPVNQLVQRRMITHLGHTCDVVSNGKAAIEAAAATAYDVIVLDLQMPEMGGLEAARAIREQPHHPWLIVLTADVTADSRQACADAGLNDFVTKPVTGDALAAAFARVRMIPAGMA
jgi:signal transduction histidine kinase/CheY-like chemotaxis protein